jgi:hypothetical protein
MYPWFLRNYLMPNTLRDGLRIGRTPAVPDALHFISGDDLDKMAGLHVPNLDEFRVEKEDVGRVRGDSVRLAFPFDRAYARGVSVFVYIQPELCGWRQTVPLSGTPGKDIPS